MDLRQRTILLMVCCRRVCQWSVAGMSANGLLQACPASGLLAGMSANGLLQACLPMVSLQLFCFLLDKNAECKR